MKRKSKPDWYPKLVEWQNWEIPRPGKEAVVGFLLVLVGSLLLHFFLIWLCSLFKTNRLG